MRKVALTNEEYYHIYNRGVDKRKVFITDRDYERFAFLLAACNDKSPLLNSTFRYRGLASIEDFFKGREKNKLVDILCFCLMPNHVLLLIKQKDKNAIKKFTQSLFTRYSIYFNRKYRRSGSLFQGRYKATNVIDKDYLLDLSRYIHKNPLKYTKDLIESYSSYSIYLGLVNTAWVNKNIILDYFNKSEFMKRHNIKSYKYFVEKFKYADEKLDLSSDTDLR